MTGAVDLPSPLALAVGEAFTAHGALARANPGYVKREQQQQMAQAVAVAIDTRTVLVAEAGTGVGKTFAYLVPALLSGQRVLISTATKNLQDQLFLRDLPRLVQALQRPVSMALLKGRSSYLCTYRLQQARDSAQLPDRFAVRALARIEQWAQQTTSGDLAEMEGLDERSPVIPLVTSSRENCLGSECPQYRGCHVMKARRDAMAADVVVVNHHLFFADLSLRDTGLAELLPSVEIAIFDEAHQLAEAGVAFLGQTLASTQLIDLARDLLAAGLQHARGLQPWQELAAQLDRAARELRLACAGPMREVRGSLRLRWDERAGRAEFGAALESLSQALAAAAAALDVVSEMQPDFDRLIQRGAELMCRVELFAASVTPGRVRWIDLGPQSARLIESPLDVRDAMRAQIDLTPKAWIFTSATLGADDALTWFTAQAGLDAPGQARTLRVASPFDYARNARLHVPADFPRPNEPAHPLAVAALAADCARAAGGRTFVLTTTLRALQQVADALTQAFEAELPPIEVLVQGTAPKRALLQRFLAAHGVDSPQSLRDSPPRGLAAGLGRPGVGGAVLVGSQSFWEGIDVPGEALQCVLIDKLPFPPPNDPLVEARVKRIEADGGNAFNSYFVAEAAVALKQGAGRLIRSETDRGLLIVCDPRLRASSYGKKLLAALPPMKRLGEAAEAIAWLREIAPGD